MSKEEESKSGSATDEQQSSGNELEEDWDDLQVKADAWHEGHLKKPEVVQKSKDNAKVMAGGFPESYVAAQLEGSLTRMSGGNFDMDEYINQLDKISEDIIGGDDSHIQRLLVIQMQLCHNMFVDCLREAMSRFHNQHNVKAYTDVGLKMEAQARRTAMALVRIRQPGVQVNIEQANIAQNQQINNGIKNTQSEILEVPNGERVDGGSETETGGGNKTLETMGEDDWPQGHQQDSLQRVEIGAVHNGDVGVKKDDSQTESNLKAVGGVK
jgi:hypothetical protein